MLKGFIFAGVLVALPAAPALAADAQPDVAYNVLFLKDGQLLAARTVVGPFGRTLRVEAGDAMRVDVLADAPKGEGPGGTPMSFTSAKMALRENGAWRTVKDVSMDAALNMTPSFEYSIEGTPYRFVVMPRRIVKADQP